MGLRLIVHAARNAAAWRAKAVAFAGVTALEIAIGDDEVVVFVRPDQHAAAQAVAAAINAHFDPETTGKPAS